MRDEENAFQFSLFCLLETHQCLFPTETGCFFNIQTVLVEQLGTQNNQKLQNTESSCLQEAMTVNR